MRFSSSTVLFLKKLQKIFAQTKSKVEGQLRIPPHRLRRYWMRACRGFSLLLSATRRRPMSATTAADVAAAAFTVLRLCGVTLGLTGFEN